MPKPVRVKNKITKTHNSKQFNKANWLQIATDTKPNWIEHIYIYINMSDPIHIFVEYCHEEWGENSARQSRKQTKK